MRISGMSRVVTACVAAMAGLVFVAGAAMAVSGGGYDPGQQNCPANADSSAAPSDPAATSPGCRSFAVNVESGGTTNGAANSDNTRYAGFGIDQSPDMDHNPSFGFFSNVGDPGTPDSPHSGCLAANTAGTGTGCSSNPDGAGFSATYDYYELYCPATAQVPLDSVPVSSLVPAPKNCASNQPVGQNTVAPDTGQNIGFDLLNKGLLVYVGADDNLDNGEHDGVDGTPGVSDGAVNGPSDGGAITFSFTPQNAANTPSGHNPEGLANLSIGLCADGICAEATTQEQTVYHGCGAPNTPNDSCAPGTPTNGNVYENSTPASTQESNNCQAGKAETNPGPCFTNADGSPNPNGLNGYRQHTPTNMNAQPGVQTYQDPDPQRSPVLPFGTPGVYVGTCGVYVNDGGGTVGPGITGQKPGYVVPGAC